MTTIDRRPTWLSSRLAGALAAIVTLAHGIAVDQPLAAIVSLGGAVGLVGTARRLASDRTETLREERAGTTVWFVASLFVLLAPTTWLGPLAMVVVYLPLAGVIFVGLSGADAIHGDNANSFFSVCWRTRDVFALAAIALGAIQTGALLALVAASARAIVSAPTSGLVAAIVLLEGVLYGVAITLPAALRELDERVGTVGDERVATVTVGDEPIEESLKAVSSWVHDNVLLVVVQVVLVVLAGPFLERSMLATGPVGHTVVAVFTSGVLHLPLIVVVVLSALVVGGGFVHEILTTRAWIDPPALATDAAGSLVAVVVIGAGSLVVPKTLTEMVFPPTTEQLGLFYGPGAVILLVTAVIALCLPIFLSVTTYVAALTGLSSDRSAGFLVGAALVLTGSIVAAEAGLSALVVFVGVGAAVLVWEFGEQASYLGVVIGNDGVSDGVETVHAAAAIGVAAVGIAIASAVGYVIGPLWVGSERATLSIVFSLVAAVFVLAAASADRTAD